MRNRVTNRVIQLLYPLAIYYVVYHLLYYILYLMMAEYVGSLVCLGIAAAVATIAMYSVYRRLPIVRAPQLFSKDTIFYELLGIIGIVALGILLNVLFTRAGFTDSASFQQANQTLTAGNLITRIIVTALMIPILEEMTFRGCLCGQLALWSNSALAILISAAVFGLLHSNLVQGVYGFLMGIFLGILYTKTKKLWCAVAAHALTNFVVILVSYF